jgi:hypothetical protein
MARIDHTACTHPRTPAGRAACRKSGAVAPTAKPVSIHAKTADELNAESRRRIANAKTTAQLNQQDRIRAYAKKHHTDAESMIQAAAEVNVPRQVFKQPKLTRAQLDSPIIQSMLKK